MPAYYLTNDFFVQPDPSEIQPQAEHKTYKIGTIFQKYDWSKLFIWD